MRFGIGVKDIERWVLVLKELVYMEKPGSGGSFLKKFRLMQSLCTKGFPLKDSTKPEAASGFMNQKLYSAIIFTQRR